MKDDFLFPMSHRLSYASSPESDMETSRPHSLYDDQGDISPMTSHRKLVRSSSDPSVNTQENIPGIPPYPAPPSYNRGGDGYRYVSAVCFHGLVYIYIRSIPCLLYPAVCAYVAVLYVTISSHITRLFFHISL